MHRTRELDRDRTTGKRKNNRGIRNSEPLIDKDEELEESEENPQSKYWLRSRPGKSCEQVIQDLISQDIGSDSESEEEMLVSCSASPRPDKSHRLHE
jgi:hypothetical protein